MKLPNQHWKRTAFRHGVKEISPAVGTTLPTSPQTTKHRKQMEHKITKERYRPIKSFQFKLSSCLIQLNTEKNTPLG